MEPLRFILLCLAGWINQEQQATIDYLREEIKILLEIHGKKPRFTDRQRKRLAVKAKKIRFGKLKDIVNLVSPHTLRVWLRKLVGQKYDSSSCRSPGRPPTAEQIVKLVVEMALSNETWGYTRIRDALFNIGHEISRDTVANILKDNGIEPGPERNNRTCALRILTHAASGISNSPWQYDFHRYDSRSTTLGSEPSATNFGVFPSTPW